MPSLLGIKIENFKSLEDVTLGQIGFNKGDDEPLPPLCCFIGANGSGKSSLLDVFAFISDCLKEGVESACDKSHRGGFHNLRTQNKKDPIRFQLYYRQNEDSYPITYKFSINEKNGIPHVVEEDLLQRKKEKQQHGRPYPFLSIKDGKGNVWEGEKLSPTNEDSKLNTLRTKIEFTDQNYLGIKTFGTLANHPRIVGLCEYLENWYLSYFVPEAARSLPSQGAHKHLDRTGSNLGNYIQYLDRKNKQGFKKVLQSLSEKVPGIKSIKHELSKDNRILIQFNEAGYKDPFYQNAMSDGTLKIFSYLLLLEDPEPYSFIGIEEPENGLYHKMLEELGTQFLKYANRGKSQICITTHSTHLVNSFSPSQVWFINKNEKGYSKIKRCSDMKTIQELYNEGIPLGNLWFTDHLEETFLP